MRIWATLLLFVGYLHVASAQPIVTYAADVSTNTDTILNFLKTPSLNAWGFLCAFNDSISGTVYIEDSNGFTGNSCPKTQNAQPFIQSNTVDKTKWSFLQNMNTYIGFDKGLGITFAHGAVDTNGNQLPWTAPVWTAPEHYVSYAGHTFYGDNCPRPEDTLRSQMDSLLSLNGTVSFDTVISTSYSFNFISGGTYFDLVYVFASDRYDTNLFDVNPYCGACPLLPLVGNAERICGNNNDGIGIFLSGNSINGSFAFNGENIAVIPNTNDPVCVRNIHPTYPGVYGCDSANVQYFISGNNPNAPFVFSGKTPPITVKKIPINPCDTYRVEIALGIPGTIGIAGNNLYYAEGQGASALIVEKHSAKTGFWQVVTTPLFDGYGLDTIVEGCPGAELTFVRFFNLAQPDSIHLQFQGTGLNGVDIDSLPEWVYFNPGQDSVSINVNALFDQLNEGVEDFTIRLLPPGEYPCPVDTTEVAFVVLERPTFGAQIADTFHFNPCVDSAITLHLDTVFGLGDFSFLWQNGATSDSIQIIPDSAGFFNVTVYDACHADSSVLTPYINRFAPAPVFQKINDLQTINCASGNLPIGIEVINNYYPQLHYLWDSGVSDSIIGVNPVYDGSYTLQLQAFLPCVPDTFSFSFELFVENDTVVANGYELPANGCPGQLFKLTPSIEGGYPDYQFLWGNNSTNDTLFVAPDSTKTYFLTVTDSCAIDSELVSFTVNVPNYEPLDLVGPSLVTLPCPSGLISFKAADFYGLGGTGDSTYQQHYSYSWNNWKKKGIEFERFVNDDTLLILQMTDTCGNDTVVHPIHIKTFHGPYLKAALKDTLHACLGKALRFGPQVNDGVLPYAYSWNNNSFDSTLKYLPQLPKSTFQVTVTDFCGFTKNAETTVYATAPVANFYAVNDSYEPRLIQFQNESDSAISYQWFFGDGGSDFVENPSYHYQELKDWEVKLVASDQYGCLDSITKELDIPLNLFIANAFTPDGDGLNETWQPLGYGFQEIGYQIYDRWGNVIFSVPRSSDTVTPWDGTSKGQPVQEGTYTYLIEVKPFVGLVHQVPGKVKVVR